MIAEDGIGAKVTASVTYPPGFLTGPSNPAIDVTSNSTCNLAGDNTTDNTICLNTLLARYMAASCSVQPTKVTYLYFPPGIYLVTNQVNPCGNGWTLFGSGPQRSIIRLAPNSAAFNTGTNIQWFNPSSVGGNSNFREFVYNMGFDVGYGNPNAIPVTTEMNNAGSFRNVTIWSEDSNCPYAINLRRSFPGPMLFKNVAVYGCANAVSSNQIEFMTTFDQFTAEGQTGTVMDFGSHKAAIQHWLSDNTGTALSVANNGGISILDSKLLNGGGAITGITVSSGASLFARNVTVTGYLHSEVDTGTGTPVTYNGNLTENWTGAASCLFCSSAHSLNLPQRETPAPTDDPVQANWTQLDTTTANWGTEIAGSSSVTVYAPPGTYSGSGTVNVTVPDTVNHLNFYNALDNSQIPQFVFTIAGTSSTPLVIDGCVYQVCTIVHTGSRTVVIRDSYTKAYQPGLGAGNLFVEDSTLGTTTSAFQPGQNIWARQLNIEVKTVPQFTCRACTLWVLGYKIETLPASPAPAFILSNGAKVEIFTQFLYPLAAAGAGTAGMYTTNSSMWVAPTFVFANNPGSGWQYWVQDTHGGSTLNLAAPGQGPGNYMLNAYYSVSHY